MKAAKAADIAIVFAGTNLKVEAEDRDRRDLLLPGAQERMIEAVYAANPRTVVVLMNGGPLSTQMGPRSCAGHPGGMVWRRRGRQCPG